MIIVEIKGADLRHMGLFCVGGVAASVDLVDEGHHDGILVLELFQRGLEDPFKNACAPDGNIHADGAVLVGVRFV